MSALVVTAENNLKYVNTKSGSEITIVDNGKVRQAIADYRGRIWALISYETGNEFGQSGTSHVSMIHYCADPSTGTFTNLNIQATALAPGTVNNICFYLDTNGIVAKTDTNGNSTQIFDLSDQPAYAIAYGMQISNQTGTIFLLCSPNNDADVNQDLFNVVKYFDEASPGNAPIEIPHSGTNYKPVYITGYDRHVVLIHDGIDHQIKQLSKSGTTGAAFLNPPTDFLHFSGLGDNERVYYVSKDAYQNPDNEFTGGNLLYHGGIGQITTDAGIISVNQGFDKN
jgi:hypothetical protein